jgi:hypothetical protein
VIEKASDKPSWERVYYMPHKPVVRQDVSTTKVRVFFHASSKPHPLASSINNCMFTGPFLQPLLWDIIACIQTLLLTKRAREPLWVGWRFLVLVMWIFSRFVERPLIGQCFIWIIHDKWRYFIG